MSNTEVLHALKDKYTVKIEWDVSENPIYIGEASIGVGSDEIGWRIRKVTFDVNDNPTDMQWASGTSKFDKVYDDRASYTYS